MPGAGLARKKELHARPSCCLNGRLNGNHTWQHSQAKQKRFCARDPADRSWPQSSLIAITRPLGAPGKCRLRHKQNCFVSEKQPKQQHIIAASFPQPDPWNENIFRNTVRAHSAHKLSFWCCYGQYFELECALWNASKNPRRRASPTDPGPQPGRAPTRRSEREPRPLRS